MKNKNAKADNQRRLISKNKVFCVKNVVCPICGDRLLITAGGAFSKEPNGDWIADEIELDCASEPKIESDEWESWFSWHYQNPYSDWFPLQDRLLKAFQNRFRFEIEDWGTK